MDDLAFDVTNAFKDEAVTIILNWYINHDLNTQWKNAIKRYPKAIVKWLKKSQKINIDKVADLIGLLNPNFSEIVETEIDIWISIASKAKMILNKDKLNNTMSFFLTLAFNNTDPKYAKLFEFSFMDVHNALKYNELEYHYWRILENKLPQVEIWRSWDKCERLRRGFVEIFINNDWPFQAFLQSVPDKETFTRILEYCNKTYNGRKYIKNLKQEVLSRNIDA
jgi:hypothetical protein